MALTPNLTVVPVTGTYVDVEGNAIAGQVRFTPRAIVTDASYGQIIISNTVTATLNASGTFTVYLPATDDTSVSPTGWTYQVVEAFTNGRTFDIAVPSATVGSLNLATVVPAAANAGTAALYVSLGQYAGVEARVTVVEGYSEDIGLAAVAAATSSVQATNASAQATIAAQSVQTIQTTVAAIFNPLLLAGA